MKTPHLKPRPIAALLVCAFSVASTLFAPALRAGEDADDAGSKSIRFGPADTYAAMSINWRAILSPDS